jgi:hypothetical protein
VSKKIFGSWYGLPEELKKKLELISPVFFHLRDNGSWASAKDAGYEEITAMVVMRSVFLSYDLAMPRIKKLMDWGVQVAIFPKGFRTIDVVFYSK